MQSAFSSLVLTLTPGSIHSFLFQSDTVVITNISTDGNKHRNICDSHLTLFIQSNNVISAQEKVIKHCLADM